MRYVLRLIGFLFTAGAILFLVGAAGLGFLLWKYAQDLPDYSQLATHEPAVMTRVHAGDGSLLAEYARERRLYTPIQAVPKMVVAAFLSAEDKNFYKHPGVDIEGIARAGLYYLRREKGQRPQGASTITQQVAKNFLLTNQATLARKIREAIPSENRVVIEGINIIKRHTKARGQGRPGGIIEREAPLHASNVQVVCPECGKPTRIGHRVLGDGRKVRFCRKCEGVVDK